MRYLPQLRTGLRWTTRGYRDGNYFRSPNALLGRESGFSRHSASESDGLVLRHPPLVTARGIFRPQPTGWGRLLPWIQLEIPREQWLPAKPHVLPRLVGSFHTARSTKRDSQQRDRPLYRV